MSETGASSLNLSGGSLDDTRSSIGVGGFTRWASEKLSVDASLVYETVSNDYDASMVALEGLPGQAFAIRSSDYDGNALTFDAKLSAELGAGWSLGGSIKVRSGDEFDDSAGFISLTWKN